MVREEADNTREDMVIDGLENGNKPNYEIPDGFNSNYLKTYYGNTLFCLFYFAFPKFEFDRFYSPLTPMLDFPLVKLNTYHSKNLFLFA